MHQSICQHKHYGDLKFLLSALFYEIAWSDRHVSTLLGPDTVFTCISYAEARNRYRLDVCPSVCHTLAPYQNG